MEITVWIIVAISDDNHECITPLMLFSYFLSKKNAVIPTLTPFHKTFAVVSRSALVGVLT